MGIGFSIEHVDVAVPLVFSLHLLELIMAITTI